MHRRDVESIGRRGAAAVVGVREALVPAVCVVVLVEPGGKQREREERREKREKREERREKREKRESKESKEGKEPHRIAAIFCFCPRARGVAHQKM